MSFVHYYRAWICLSFSIPYIDAVDSRGHERIVTTILVVIYLNVIYIIRVNEANKNNFTICKLNILQNRTYVFERPSDKYTVVHTTELLTGREAGRFSTRAKGK